MGKLCCHKKTPFISLNAFLQWKHISFLDFLHVIIPNPNLIEVSDLELPISFSEANQIAGYCDSLNPSFSTLADSFLMLRKILNALSVINRLSKLLRTFKSKRCPKYFCNFSFALMLACFWIFYWSFFQYEKSSIGRSYYLQNSSDSPLHL